MRALIVESDTELGQLWAGCLGARGLDAHWTDSVEEAFALLRSETYEVIILDVVLGADTDGFAVSDYASVVQPEAQLIVASNSDAFSDGSIFHLCANARAFVPAATAPEDLATIAEHYARTAHRRTGRPAFVSPSAASA